MKSALFVFLGGGTGSLARYMITLLVPTADRGYPWATFLANVVACFAAGLLTAWLGAPERSQFRFLLVTGFCGGFSTFSAYSVESVKLVGDGKLGLAALYVAASLLCCLLGAFAGTALAR